MNPFLLPPDERLIAWRNFRKSLTSDLTDLEHLQKVAEWWLHAPLVNRNLDYYTPSSWATPWEIMVDGMFCTSTVGFMMEQTLLFTDCNRWTTDRIELCLVKDEDPIKGDICLMVLVDKKYLLNYSIGEVVEIDKLPPTFIILQKYRFDDKKHIEI